VRCIADSAPAPRPTAPDGQRPAVSLRGFRPSDIPFVAGIVADALREHYDPNLYLSLGAEWPDGFLIAADEHDVPIGFLLGVSQVEHEARILMFAVDRHQRNRGIGQLLMERFVERCLARRYRRATLEVRVSNATAIRFYTRFHFSVVDLLRAYYSDGENGYQMARPLP
jgi:[ribosomal protein S18]-alanine N-acetyltransferase